MQNSSDYPYKEAPAPHELISGMGTTFVVERSFYRQLEKPFSECGVLDDQTLVDNTVVDTFLFDATRRTGFAYERRTCVDFCYQLFLAKECNCLDRSILFNVTDANTGHSYADCLTDENFDCMKKFYLLKFSQREFINTNCVTRCPLECYRSQMRITKRQYKHPISEEYAAEKAALGTWAKTHANESEFREALANHLVEFSVYYDRLAYTLWDEERKMTWMDLIGILGGHFHLFLGMSVVSFCQLGKLVLVSLPMRACRWLTGLRRRQPEATDSNENSN